MVSLLRLVEIIPGSPGNNLLLMLYVIPQHFKKIHDLRFVIHKGKHDDTEGILHLRMLVKLVHDHVCIGIAPQLDHHTHAFSVRFIPQIRDTVDLFCLDKLGDLQYHVRLVYHIRKLRHDNTGLTVCHGLNIGDSPYSYLSPSGSVSLLASPCSQYNSPGGKVRRFHDRQYLVNLRIPVLRDPVVNNFNDSLYHLPKIMGRNIGGHANGNPRGSVYKKIWKTAWKNTGLLFCLVKVGNKVNRILIDVRKKLHGNLAQTRFRVTHGRRSVSVHGTEVSMAVHQNMAHGPGLGHIYQRPVNGTVSMRMIFTHGITDDTGAFSVRFIRSVIQLNHGIENSSLHRL